VSLIIIPIVWATFGGSAAWLLNVSTDYALLAAGALAIVGLIVPARPLS